MSPVLDELVCGLLPLRHKQTPIGKRKKKCWTTPAWHSHCRSRWKGYIIMARRIDMTGQLLGEDLDVPTEILISAAGDTEECSNESDSLSITSVASGTNHNSLSLMTIIETEESSKPTKITQKQKRRGTIRRGMIAPRTTSPKPRLSRTRRMTSQSSTQHNPLLLLDLSNIFTMMVVW